MKKITLFITALFLYIGIISAQSADSLVKVTDGVYMLTGCGGNISFLVTGEGVVVVDAGDNAHTGQKIQENVARVTGKPIIYTIITHYHYDHTGGLATFPANVPILAHEKTIENLKNREKDNKTSLNANLIKSDSLKNLLTRLKAGSPEYIKNDSLLKATEKSINELSTYKFVYPTEFMSKDFQIVKGKDTIKVFHDSPAHTNGDLVVWFKNRNVMVLGDLFFNHAYPYIDNLGNIESWAKQLRVNASANLSYYVPGHGNVAVAGDLLVMAKYLEDLRAQVNQNKKEGKSLDEMKNTIKLPENEYFDFKFFREQNIEAALNQLNR